MFTGSMVALVTPFKNKKIDEKSLKKLVRFQLENRTNGLVPCGTTGESATLSHQEHKRVIEIVVKEAAGEVPVVAGAGSNSTEETVALCRHAHRIRADGVLLIAPYYNKPTQEGLYLHFSTIARTVPIPIILYNIPGRTGVNMLPSTVIRLAKECRNIVGIKEASGNLDQSTEIIRSAGKNFSLVSGDDALTLPLLAIGGKGVISVAANIIPRDVSDMVVSWQRGDHERARQLHQEMFPLIKALFLETNPIPLKTVMGNMGLCRADLRLPLSPMSGNNKKILKKVLKEYGIRT